MDDIVSDGEMESCWKSEVKDEACEYESLGEDSDVSWVNSGGRQNTSSVKSSNPVSRSGQMVIS
jgi:hypothetical protein